MTAASIKRMTLRAFFVALVALLGLTPLGLIPLGFINITILVLPVVSGTMLMGLKTGLMLGFFFGTVSMMSMLGLSATPPSMLAGQLLAASPFLAVTMCYAPRMLVPVVAWTVHQKMHAGKAPKAAMPAAAAAASFTNTVLYLGMMYAFYAVSGLDAKPILTLILGTGLIAGTAEAAAAALLTPPVVLAVRASKLYPKE